MIVRAVNQPQGCDKAMGLNDLCAKCRGLVDADLSLTGAEFGDGLSLFGQYVNEHFLFLDRQRNNTINSNLENRARERIAVQGLPAETGYDVPLQNNSQERDVYFHHCLEDFTASVVSGCHMCNLIEHNFSSLPDKPEILDGCIFLPILSSSRFIANENERSELEQTHAKNGASIQHDFYGDIFFLIIEVESWRLVTKGCDIQFKRILHDIQLTHGPPATTVRPKTVAAIAAWIKECQTTHESCRQQFRIPGVDTRPARLLEIDATKSPLAVRLKQSDSIIVPDGCGIDYACLSHRWGNGGSQCQLQLDNYTQYLQDIAWDSLPATFRQALSFTASLGVKYLWIDALCILQDSAADWENEAPRMAFIYANCKFSVAASAGHGADQGLLLQNNLHANCFATVNWSNEEDRVMVGFRAFDDNIPFGELPLYKRGWVFQERYITPRVIHFMADQLRWDCQAGMHCELATHRDRNGPLPDFGTGRYHRIGLGPDKWGQVFVGYSDKQLTKNEDRLIAISGMAQFFAHFNEIPQSSDYIAGLWRSTLKESLLWYSDTDDEFAVDASTKYVAPTWSWASVHGKVSIDPSSKSFTLHPRYSIEDVGVRTKTSNYFSSVVLGYINMTTHLLMFECIIASDRLRVNGSVRISGHFDLPDASSAQGWYDCLVANRSTGYFHPDCRRNIPGGTALRGVVCPLMCLENETMRITQCLALVPVTGRKGIYRRVGMLRILKFASCERPEVPSWETCWNQSSLDIKEDGYIKRHESGTYEIRII